MPQRPEDLIRRLGRRYGAVLLVVAALLLVDQAILQPLLVRLNLSAPVINLAGRQRMLSQRIVKDALTIALMPPEASMLGPQLVETVSEWRRVHAGLRDGNSTLHLEASTDPRIKTALAKVESHVAAISESVAEIIHRPAASKNAIQAMLAAEQAFLPEMDRIVQLYEVDAQAQIQRLRQTGLIATALVIALMTGLYWLVLRPAAALIREQVNSLAAHERQLIDARDHLERRVVERTRQLRETNTALATAAEERTVAEQRTLQLQSQLAHASRITSLGELATGIAHEMNQPLGAISNFAETLLVLNENEHLDRSAVQSTATRIRDAAQRAGQIIRRMRNFVRSRNEWRTAEDLNPLITDVLALCDPDLRGRGVRVDFVGDETTATTVVVDEIQLQQVLVNLVRNAAQAMESRPENQRRLTISTMKSETSIAVMVEDTGPGFQGDPELHLRPLMSTKPDGMGLGLSISQSIMAAHGGTLSAGNRPSGGGRVTISLPWTAPLELCEHADRLCCR